MSTTIDQRVVEMQFDNAHFERNVATTMSTLDKLKQSLNLTGASKGLEDVSSAARKFDMSGLGSAVETVQAKFSAMGVIGVTALANITNSAVNTGKRLISALTVDPIKTGFSEYETKMNAVQTIMANTASKGKTIGDVTKVLGDLNTYADKTIYNFAEMTRNIGTFTAAGVDLETSANAIQGIANLAAVSGSSSQQASTAMYQLSQALAAGTVKLMDWNSVVNAGMGGEMFQNALKETSRLLGTGADAAIEAEGSFRESLKAGWLTAEVLTETLKKFTSTGAIERVAEYTGISHDAVQAALDSAKAQYGEAEAIEYASKALAEKSGKSADEIKSTLEFAKNAEDAATKVKTFTQLWDTLKESAQSGWSQTWELIVGDFEEAKTFLTELSDLFGGMISASADSRNSLLSKALGDNTIALTEDQLQRLDKISKKTGKSFEELKKGITLPTGRELLINSLRNSIEALLSVVRPIKEAFREIFPPMTALQLYNMIDAFHNFTSKLILSETASTNLKKTFTGLFSVVDIVFTVVKEVAGGIAELVGNFTGFQDKILDVTASYGEWLAGLRDSVKETNVIGIAVDKVVGFLSNLITKLKEFGAPIRDAFKVPDFTGFRNVFSSIWNFISNLGSKVVDVISSITSGLVEFFGGTGFFDVLNSGLSSGILVAIQAFVWKLTGVVDEAGGFFENITGILDDVRGCFQAYQEQLKAGTLLKIAGAIGILAAAILVLSTIDQGSMAQAMAAITVLFTELISSLAVFTKFSESIKGSIKGSALLISMSASLLILAGAMKVLSTLDTAGIAKGLIGIGVLMAELVAFLNFAKFGSKVASTTFGIVLLSSAMLILASAVEDFANMSWEGIGKGLTAIGGLLAELAIFTKLTGNAKHVMSTGMSMIMLGASMKIFASALADFSRMSWAEIGRGLTAMAGALAEVTLALNLMPKNMLSIGVGLVAVSAAVTILAGAFSSFGGMSWEEIGRGLTAMGGALAELTIALNLMNGTLTGSAALIIAAGALAILAPVMKTLGEMSLGEIGKGLIAIAGGFAVVGIAGMLLAPLVPTILGLAAAFALFGVATLGVGAGLAAIALGLSTLATVGAAGATAIVAAITVIATGILSLIPSIAVKLAEAVIIMAETFAAGVPKLVEAGMKLVLGVLEGISAHIGDIVKVTADIIVKFLEGISKQLPRVIQSGINLMISFINGMADGIRNNADAVISAVNNLMDAVIEAIAKWFTNAISRGKELVTNIATGILDNVSAAKEAVGEVITKAIDTVEKKISDFKDAGKNVIDGFINGIKEKIAAVGDAASEIGKKALNSIKDFLGIESPSREFTEVGEYSGEGFVGGLRRFANVAKRAAEEVGSDALNSMRKSISNIANVISSDIDTQPTIRPVLDLSDVRSGAGTISSMFNANPSVGVLAEVGVISTMMNSRSQNGSNAEVVSAIDKLRHEMGMTERAIYNINGVTYDDGSNISDAVRTIVRAARIERRS